MRKKIVCLLISALVINFGCNKEKHDFYQQPENTFSIKGTVHELDLYPDPPPPFPEHEGKAEFTAYCGICHTLKYITIQPAFPAKTWEAEVNKMITKFKAPIDSVTARKITAYLVAVKSNGK